MPRVLAVLLLALSLAACAGDDVRAQLHVSQARLVQRGGDTALELGLMFRPSELQLQALEHGVPLNLRLVVSGAHGGPVQTVHLGLRYFPLSRRYQLHLQPGGDRSFAVRGYLLEALQRLRVPLPHNPCVVGGECRVQVQFDYARLPGVLRLPALIRPAWQVPTARAGVQVVGA